MTIPPTEKALKAVLEIFCSGMNRRDGEGKVLTEAGKMNKLADVIEGTDAQPFFERADPTEPEWEIL